MHGIPKEDVTRRYMLTLEQLAIRCSAEDVPHMITFLPLLKDCFEQEQQVIVFKIAKRTLMLMLEAAKGPGPGPVMDAILKAKIIPALVSRLSDPSVAIVQTCLSAIGMLADNSNIEHMMRLDATLLHITDMIEKAAGGLGNERISIGAAQCLRKICHESTQCVDMIADMNPEVFNALVVIVNKAQDTKNPCRDVVAVHAASVLMVATKYISDLEILDQIGIYILTFQIISVFYENVEVVEVALSALQRLLMNQHEAKSRQAVAEKSRTFSATNAWNIIVKLSEEYEASSDDTDDGEDCAYVGGRRWANSHTARRILKNAVQNKLFESLCKM